MKGTVYHLDDIETQGSEAETRGRDARHRVSTIKTPHNQSVQSPEPKYYFHLNENTPPQKEVQSPEPKYYFHLNENTPPQKEVQSPEPKYYFHLNGKQSPSPIRSIPRAKVLR